MRFKTILMAAVAATLPVLGACDQPTIPATPATPGAAVEQRSAPTSAIDPTTGELVAGNYRPAGTVVTMPTPGASSGSATAYEFCSGYEPCEPCDPNDPYGACYTPPCSALIIYHNTYRAGAEPYGSLEVSGTTHSGCGFLVLTGIGARINGSDDYTTLHLRGRRINADGSWGETMTYRFGSSPNHSLEAWAEVPSSGTDFYGIVGVGLGQSGTEDVRTLMIAYRKLELTASGVRATGPTYRTWVGANPFGPLDVSFVSATDNEVFVGAGFRSVDAGERTVTMAAQLGILP
jgi:hypothetical protein